MRHYVCIGDCVVVSSMPGVCTTEGCTHEGKSLIPCQCDDEMHDEAFAKTSTTEFQQDDSVSDDEEPSDDSLMSIDEEEEESTSGY